MRDVPRLLAANMSLPGRIHPGIRRHRKKDGTVIDVDIYAHEVVLEGRPLRLAILRDVTEQKRLEDPIPAGSEDGGHRNSDKRIAHDFNNLLTPILGFSAILAKREQDLESQQAIAEVRQRRQSVRRRWSASSSPSAGSR